MTNRRAVFIKELYLANSLEELDGKYALPNLSQKKARQLCKTAVKLFETAEKYRLTGDEESAYVSYMKYLQLISEIKKSSDYTKEKSFIMACLGPKNPYDALDQAEKLKNSLKERYSSLRLRRLNELEQQNEVVRRKIDEDRRRVIELKANRINNLPGENDTLINCNQLYALLKDYEKKILIMDTRPRNDFQESHISFLQCISIPESVIIAGYTANKIEQQLPSESILLWSQRKDVDLIVLLDWSSMEIVSGKTLHTLRTILLKWDRDVIYKQQPVILEGGYEEWLNCYPTYTTNSHVSPPNHNTPLDDLLNDIDYSELTLSLTTSDTFKPDNNNVNDFRGLPSIDRSSKAAALSVYEQNSRQVKKTLEEQEKLANDSLNIERQRLLAEKTWESLSHSNEDDEDNSLTSLQLKKNELLSELLQLENAQQDKAMENQRLKDELAEYKRREKEAALSQEKNEVITEKSNESLGDLDSPNANYPDEIIKESIAKEEKIRAIEEQKTALIQEREALQADREKKLAEARAKKKLLNLQIQDENKTSHNTQYESDENKFPVKIPQVDRATKPSIQPSIPPSYYETRQRDFQAVSGCLGYGLTGLKNLGNTCYMNSILQCLNNTSYLVQYFCNGQYRDHMYRSENKQSGTCGAVAEEVAAVIKALWSGQYRFISTKDFKNVVGQYKNMFRGAEQQDSHEFLTILMDWLHDDLQIPITQNIKMDSLHPSEKAWQEYTKSKESLILKLFYGQIKSTVKCLECGKESVTYDSFSNLSLELPANTNKCSLSDCLELYLKNERIYGWHCPMCKQKRDAVKKLDISRLPPVLVIHFKRFYIEPKDYISNTYKKKQTYIDFPLENLNMQKFSIGGRCDNVNYNLYGVSNHYGTMEGGHYTAYCKNSECSKWYKFDDHLVNEISPNDVKSSAAYILFYTSMLPESALKIK